MILIPAQNGFNKSNLPVVTFLLVIFNVIAFFVLQSNDNKLYYDAYTKYSSANLLSKEKPIFEQYAQRHRYDIYEKIKDKTIDDNELIGIILFDKKFTHHLTEKKISGNWQQLRQGVNDLLQSTSTYQYSYYPSEPSWFTAFSHMFMHGDLYHLLGNMLFLFLFGYNLEILLGKSKMLAVYFASGIAAVAFFAFTTEDKFIPLVGASGAISGLMGGFAGYYGLKRIRYLFWIFVYFNYIKLPALLVLVYWLLKELIQSSNNDGVAYMAHFGGLVAGFLIVFILKQFKSKKVTHTSNSSNDQLIGLSIQNSDTDNLSFAKQAQDISSRENLLNKAKTAVKELNFDLAKDYYRQLLINEPINAELYSGLYNLEKKNLNSTAYKELVTTIISKINHNSSLETLADTCIQDIKAHAGNFNPYSIDTLFIYCHNCLKRKQPKLIRSVINHLVKHYSDHADLPNLLLHFAFAIEKDGDWNTKHKVLTFLSKNFASSFAGQEAKRELESNH